MVVGCTTNCELFAPHSVSYARFEPDKLINKTKQISHRQGLNIIELKF